MRISEASAGSAQSIALVEAFCGAAVSLENLNARLLLGEAIDPAQHAQTVSAMVRVGSRLGLARRVKDVTPTLSDYLRQADYLRQTRAADAGNAGGDAISEAAE
jgi:hypothetical protein